MSKQAIKTKKSKFLPGLVVVIVLAAIGSAFLMFSGAAGTATLTLSPASGSYDINTNFTLSIYADTLTDSVGAGTVDARLTYDTTKLTFVSVNSNGGAFTNCFDNSGGSGSVTLTCSKLGTALTGKQKVGEVTFTAKVGTGTSAVTFGTASSILRGDGGSTNLWNGITTGGTYSFTTPDTTPPSVSITAPTAGATVQSNVPITATASDDSGTISKVEFYVNNVLKSTDTSSPYSYTWDSTTVADTASLPIYAKAYDAATPTPNPATSPTVNVKVQNNKPNLAVSGITLSPAAPVPGDVVTITANVTNNGTLALPSGSSVATGFSIDGTALTAPVDTTALAIGASRTATITWTATRGAHTIVATADKTNVIVEVNESDNNFTKSVNVNKPGDANGDNAVNALDLNIFSFNYGKTGMTFAQGDFNGDGTINALDVNILSFNWGK